MALVIVRNIYLDLQTLEVNNLDTYVSHAVSHSASYKQWSGSVSSRVSSPVRASSEEFHKTDDRTHTFSTKSFSYRI
jgi:hypothetical protein